jgi:pseudomonalisin/xanthomonalisin
MLALAALAALSMSAYAQVWVPTFTKTPRIPDGTTHLGVMQNGAPISVTIALKVRNKNDLDALTVAIAAGNARPISSAEFQTRFAPTPDQVQAVVNYLTQNGFTNITVDGNRLLVSADGTAATVRNAFNTEMHVYKVNGRLAHGHVGDVSVPQKLDGVVLAVHGLQTLHLHHTMMAKPLATTASATGHNPTDFPIIYNASGLPSATNATIGIITQGSMTQTVTDLKSFASKAGYPVPNVSVVTVGTASTDTSGVGEWNMDTQDALAAAGGTIKQMLLYTATTLSDADLTKTYNKAVTDNLAKAINVSLGECENDAKSSGIMASNDQIFQTAVAQGQTFSVSSGDSGSYECGGFSSAQSYPAVSPYVIAIGGTTLNTSGTTWTSETVWSCSSYYDCPQSASGGAGGGPSLTEAAPSWQTSAGVLGSSTKRGVPDVSFDAAPSSGALVLINGSTQQIGGTSLAAPLFTGFWARVQSMNNNSLGFAAPAIYKKAAGSPNMFHDVTSGSNGGYSAKTGWDYASGYGSMNIANLAAAMGSSGSTTTTTTATSGTTTTTVATTTTTTAGTCYNSSNYYHVYYGRAHDSGGYAYANGSNQYMGFDNLYYTTKLRKTGTNYYVIDNTCP